MIGAGMYDLKRLRLLREVHFRGTLAAAAQALGYNPSSVSHQLTILEREVGVRLLEPAGRGVRLTDAALILVAHTEEALRHLEEAQAEVAAAAGQVRGLVRVAIFQTAAHAVLAEVANDLARLHPGLRLHVSHIPAQEALPGLIAGDFDLVLQEEFPGQPEIRVPGAEITLVGTDPMWLATAADDPLSDLAEASSRCWALEPKGTLVRSWAEATCRAAGFEPIVSHETSDIFLQLNLAAAGVAVALVPGLGLASAPDTLHRLSLTQLPDAPARSISVAVRRGATRHPSIATARDLFVGRITERLRRSVAR